MVNKELVKEYKKINSLTPFAVSALTLDLFIYLMIRSYSYSDKYIITIDEDVEVYKSQKAQDLKDKVYDVLITYNSDLEYASEEVLRAIKMHRGQKPLFNENKDTLYNIVMDNMVRDTNIPDGYIISPDAKDNSAYNRLKRIINVAINILLSEYIRIGDASNYLSGSYDGDGDISKSSDVIFNLMISERNKDQDVQDRLYYIEDDLKLLYLVSLLEVNSNIKEPFVRNLTTIAEYVLGRKL